MSSTNGYEYVPPINLYRILRVDENPAGIVAKNPDAERSVLSHVICGGRSGYESQFISTSASLTVAKKYMQRGIDNGLTGLTIGKFTVSQLPQSCKMIDLTRTVIRNEQLGNVVRANNFAKASAEVLLQYHKPLPCIVIYPLPNGFNC